MRKRRKTTLIIILTAMLGLLIGGVIASSAFFIYNYFNNVRVVFDGEENLQQKKEYVLFDDYHKSEEAHEDEPKIVEYSLKNYSDPKEPKFYLGEQGIQKLKTKIINQIGYGPEMFLLDSIIIGNESLITEEANGEYLPNTNQIIINLDSFKDYLPFSQDEPNFYLETKVNAIFEIIFHEYNHHLAYVYLNSLKDSDSLSTKNLPKEDKKTLNPLKIFHYNEKNKEANQQVWNKHFVKWFKKLLNYDKDTKLNKGSFKESTLFSNISRYLNQKDLFEIANNQTNKKYDSFENWLQNQKMRLQEKERYQRNNLFNNLSYLYSLDELFARKYQQLSQVYESYPDNPDTHYLENGLIEGINSINLQGKTLFIKGVEVPSDIAFNTFMYQDTFDTKYNLVYSLKNPDNPVKVLKTKRFQFDAPFENELFSNAKDIQGEQIKSYPKDLYNLMRAHMGHLSTFNFSEEPQTTQKDYATYLNQDQKVIKDGADISFMWRPNNSNLISVGEQKGITINNEKNSNLIKFGGYINNNLDNPLVSISFGNNQNSYEVFVSDFTYKHKEKLVTSQLLDLEEDVEKHFYVTKDWIDASKITNEQIYFVFKDEKRIPLKSIRKGDFGVSSTYLPFLTFKDETFFEDNQNSIIQFVAKTNSSNQVFIERK